MVSRLIDRGCLFVVLAIVGLRPLVLERYDSAGLTMTRAMPGVQDASPAATAVVDLVLLLAAVAWLAGRTFGPDRTYRKCGIEWALLVLAVAAAASCVTAGQQRLAVNGALDWLCCALVAVLLVQLLRDAWDVRLALAVIIASATAQAVECFDQEYVWFAETETQYERNKTEFWQRQNVPLDSPQVRLFEARLRSREASGFLAHSNVTGAYLATCALSAAAAAAASRWALVRANLPAVFAALVVSLGLTAAMLLTNSRGAIAAFVIAGALWMARLAFSAAYMRHRIRVFRGAWATVIAAALAVAAYGAVRDALPGRSLLFRWQYWTASVGMLADHPWTGVGSGNFGRHYLQYKSIDAPEEVANPHNMFVSAATSWGLAGLIGMIALVYGGSRQLTEGEPAATSSPDERRHNGAQPFSGPSPRARALLWGALLIVAVFASRLAFIGSSDASYLYATTMLAAIAWAAGFAVIMAVPVVNVTHIVVGLGFALVAFVLQDMVNFASIVPATTATAFALYGVAAGARCLHRALPPVRRATMSFAFVIGIVTTASIAALVIRPVWQADAHLQRARSAQSWQTARSHYESAARVDPLDPTPLYEAAQLAGALAKRGNASDDQLDVAQQWLTTAIRRDPFRGAIYSLRAQLHLLAAERTDGTQATVRVASAVAAATHAIQLYPTDPDGWVRLGDCYARQAEVTVARDAAHAAVNAYRRALELDAARPQWETIRRMTDRQRAAILEKIEAVEQLTVAHKRWGRIVMGRRMR